MIYFDKEKHKYFNDGIELSGITKLISKKLGLNYSGITNDSYMNYGTFVHEEVSKAIEKRGVTFNQDALWVIDNLYKFKDNIIYSERLVSDYVLFASAIDIMIMTGNKKSVIIDIKTGNFDRAYCTLQLSVYEYFLSLEGIEVEEAFVYCTKDRFVYKIYTKIEKAKELLGKKE